MIKIKVNLELDDNQLEKYTDFLVWLKEDRKSKIKDLKDKEECWACNDELPIGSKSGLCNDCKIRG